MSIESTFPVCDSTDFDHEPGMSLRDYFAAKAMQGILAADTDWNISAEKAAEWAYLQADQMLKAREVGL